MDLTGHDVAGVVDLFGALTRAELGEALAELAFKRGEDHDPDAFAADIDAAVRSYHLVAVEPDATDAAVDETLYVVGPVAFPELPEGATDLPHILDVESRNIERETVARAAERRFRDDASAAVEAGDTERIEALLDVSYELEAWGGVDLARSRDRLDATLQ
ncbi:DUF7109 family protein [Salinibaculum rarum]|uniref:DUF7109 family protein n=1 Tax=Salinibaculum rarum TaxID=3058903 RepID=UPI00265F6604|nr:hypothetical protein [Salinibaculum sp. KK48]